MASFNLTDNPWIPVIMQDGSNCKLSLIELFEKAHEIREIFCESPLETISLNRFLQALLIRIYEVNNKDNWWNLWKIGKFDITPLKNYFNKWYRRFDIFDKERPFYQSIISLSTDTTPISKLRHDVSSTNNATLFDHTYDNQDFVIPLWRIPILLITAQSYSVGGGISKPFNLSGAPLVAGCTFWLNENSLFKSLLLNTDYDNIDIKSTSTCAWERDYCVKCIIREPEDYLDYLTWQSRSIKFNYDSPLCFDDKGNMIFGENKAQMYFHQGDKLKFEFNDPLMAKRATKDNKIVSVRFDTKKALWRHAEILFEFKNKNGTKNNDSGVRTARNILFVANNIMDLNYDIYHKFEIEAFGLLNDQAKVVIIKKENLPFFPSLIKDNNENVISYFINLAEKQGKILYGVLLTLGRFILYPAKEENSNLSKDERKDINGFISTLAIEKNYWASLESLFLSYLQKIATTNFDSTEEFVKYQQDIAFEIFNIAKTSFENSTRNFDSTAKHLRAITLAKNKLYPIKLEGDKHE